MLWMWLVACSGGEDVEVIVIDEPAVEDIVVVDLDEDDAAPEPESDDAPKPDAPTEPVDEPNEADPTVPDSRDDPKKEPPTEVAQPVKRPDEPTEAEVTPEAAEENEPEPEPAKTITYALNAQKSSLYVQVYKDRTTAGADLSHDHVMLATGWTGSATWNTDDLSQCDIQLTLKVAKLAVDPPNLRSALGIEGELTDGNRKDIKKNMLAKGQLDSASYPEIRFQSTACEASGAKIKVTGELTVHGTTKTVTTKMLVNADDSSFSATGGFKAKHTDFGMDPFTAMLGALKNENEMKFTASLKGEAE